MSLGGKKWRPVRKDAGVTCWYRSTYICALGLDSSLIHRRNQNVKPPLSQKGVLGLCMFEREMRTRSTINSQNKMIGFSFYL